MEKVGFFSFFFVASGSRKFVKMEKVNVCHVRSIPEEGGRERDTGTVWRERERKLLPVLYLYIIYRCSFTVIYVIMRYSYHESLLLLPRHCRYPTV